MNIAGDFNCCLLDIDRDPQTHIRDSSRKVLQNFVKVSNYVIHGSPQLTWMTGTHI